MAELKCLRCRFNAAVHNDFNPCGPNRIMAGLDESCVEYAGFMQLGVLTCLGCRHSGADGTGCEFVSECKLYDESTPSCWEAKQATPTGQVAVDPVVEVIATEDDTFESIAENVANCNQLVTEPVDTRTGYGVPAADSRYAARGGIEPIDFIMSNDLSFLEANVVKYVYRYPFKNGIEDLKKARDYLNMLIRREEEKPNA